MSHRVKIFASLIPALLFLFLCGGCATLADLDKLRAIHAVTPEAWREMRTGMTKGEVIQLLGYSECVMSGSSIVNGHETIRPEIWQYNWTDGSSSLTPSDKAFVVYFDQTGKVLAFRPPKGDSTSKSMNLPDKIRIGEAQLKAWDRMFHNGDETFSKLPPEIGSVYLVPTNRPNTYDLIRQFKLPDGRTWNVPPLTLILGQEIRIPIESKADGMTDIKEMRCKLLSINEDTAVLESTHVIRSHGKEETIRNKQTIKIKKKSSNPKGK